MKKAQVHYADHSLIFKTSSVPFSLMAYWKAGAVRRTLSIRRNFQVEKAEKSKGHQVRNLPYLKRMCLFGKHTLELVSESVFAFARPSDDQTLNLALTSLLILSIFSMITCWLFFPCFIVHLTVKRSKRPQARVSQLSLQASISRSRSPLFALSLSFSLSREKKSFFSLYE